MAAHSCSARECGEPVAGSETEESGLIDSNSHSAWQCHFSINKMEIQSFLIIFVFLYGNEIASIYLYLNSKKSRVIHSWRMFTAWYIFT